MKLGRQRERERERERDRQLKVTDVLHQRLCELALIHIAHRWSNSPRGPIVPFCLSFQRQRDRDRERWQKTERARPSDLLTSAFCPLRPHCWPIQRDRRDSDTWWGRRMEMITQSVSTLSLKPEWRKSAQSEDIQRQE